MTEQEMLAELDKTRPERAAQAAAALESDYEPGDEFDWDRNDRSQYCKHGTFIGSWWGPDLMCGPCEMGD